MDIRAVLKNLKFTQCLAPTPKDNDDFAGNTYVDTQGLNALLFLISVGDLAAAIGSTTEGTALKIEECDTTGGTALKIEECDTTGGTYTDVTGAALADAIANDEDNGLFAISVDLSKSHKRYMQVTVPHAGDGSGTDSLLEIIAIGFPLNTSPTSAAQMGLTEFIEG